MSLDLETIVRTDLHRAADTLSYDPDLDAIFREANKTFTRNRWGRALLAAAAVVAVAFGGLQFVNRTVPALPPAPMGQPSDANPPLNEATRTHLPFQTRNAGVDAVMTEDGRSVVFTSGGTRVTVAVPEAGRVLWSPAAAPFAAMVINGPATKLRPLQELGAFAEYWTLVPMPSSTLTVATMAVTEATASEITALVWGDAAGGFHSVDGRADSVVRFTMTAPWFEKWHDWVVVEDPVAGVIAWPDDSARTGPFDRLSTDPFRLNLQIAASGTPAGIPPGDEMTFVAIAVLPPGAGQVTADHGDGYTVTDPPTSMSLASGRQVVMATWRGRYPTPPGSPSLSLTYTTADGRQVVLTP